MNTAMLMVVARGPVASKRVLAVRARIHCHVSRRAGNATTPIATDKGSKPVWTLPCITSMRPPVSPYNTIREPIRIRATVPMVAIWRLRACSDSFTLVSVTVAISVRPPIDNEARWLDDIVPGLGREVGGFSQVENSARQTLLIGPLLSQLPARKQIAVGAPLLIDVLARGHEILVWPKEYRSVLFRTAAREPQHDRSSVGRAW